MGHNMLTHVAARLEVLYAFYFFFHDTATTEIYTLSLHDALPIFSFTSELACASTPMDEPPGTVASAAVRSDRKSTRLNSSHVEISYAVFCLKKKKSSSEQTIAQISHAASREELLKLITCRVLRQV